jgi:hypothetical protein
VAWEEEKAMLINERELWLRVADHDTDRSSRRRAIQRGMAKQPHKHSGEHLTARTVLSKEAIAELAAAVVPLAHGNAWNSPGKVRFEHASTGRLDFSVQAPGPFSMELMTFALTTAEVGEITKIDIRIVDYKTRQQKYGTTDALGGQEA